MHTKTVTTYTKINLLLVELSVFFLLLGSAFYNESIILSYVRVCVYEFIREGRWHLWWV